jgi:predicted  nucleic acid-binding Zn-ribbon protein
VLLKYNREIVPSLEDKIKNSNLEIDEYRRRLSGMSELTKNNQEIMNRLKAASQENEQYMRRIQEYEFRMSQIAGEIERLNGVLRGKTEELSNSEAKFKQVTL